MSYPSPSSFKINNKSLKDFIIDRIKDNVISGKNCAHFTVCEHDVDDDYLNCGNSCSDYVFYIDNAWDKINSEKPDLLKYYSVSIFPIPSNRKYFNVGAFVIIEWCNGCDH